jgi:AcrR family transcriptional regulator
MGALIACCLGVRPVPKRACGTPEHSPASGPGAILDAAARVPAGRSDAGLVDVADEVGVGRATLYRYYATREPLVRDAAQVGLAELADAIDATKLDGLPVDRAGAG